MTLFYLDHQGAKGINNYFQLFNIICLSLQLLDKSFEKK